MWLAKMEMSFSQFKQACSEPVSPAGEKFERICMVSLWSQRNHRTHLQQPWWKHRRAAKSKCQNRVSIASHSFGHEA